MNEHDIRFDGIPAPAAVAGGAGRGGGGTLVSTDPRLDRSCMARIGDHLRAMYDEGAREPIPVDWLELLHRVDTPER
ncbi:MAG: NepR family anti-sigma factor [Microvirga sp.]